MEIPFLSSSLTFTLTYLWAKRNSSIRISFLGIFTFAAPFLPITLIAFNVIVHSVIPWADALGFVVGHLYYYLEDIYPRLPSSNSFHPLATPNWFKSFVSSPTGIVIEPIEDINMDNLEN